MGGDFESFPYIDAIDAVCAVLLFGGGVRCFFIVPFKAWILLIFWKSIF